MSLQPYILQTARLGLRQHRASDVELLLPVFGDPYAAQFYPAMGRPEGIARWINWNLNNYADYDVGLWALELLGSGQFIGDAGISWQTVEEQRLLEIGWHIHPGCRVLGYAAGGRARVPSVRVPQPAGSHAQFHRRPSERSINQGRPP
jgi:RimJ/RimL family protein N-acetyltransferase